MDKILVVDVGGTDIKFATMSTSGQFISSVGKVSTPKCDDENLYGEVYLSYVELLKSLYKNQKDIIGIAISHPGIMNRGYIEYGGGLIYTSKHNLAQDLSLVCDNIPVTILNDAKCATMAETTFGVLNGVENCACMTFGTAVGCGVVVNGSLLENESGEISFVSNLDHEEVSGDYIANNFENYFGLYGSATTFIENLKVKLNLPESCTGKDIFETYINDEVYRDEILKELDEFTLKIARQIFNMNLFVKLDKIAVGGGISNQPIFVEKINENLIKLSQRLILKIMNYPTKVPQVVQCKFKSEANLIGALGYFNQSQQANVVLGESYVQ